MPEWKRRVLVVEDDPFTSALLKKMLEGAGFATETADSALGAKSKVEKFDPDLAILDVQLGDGPSGLDLAFALNASRPDLGLLILTRHPTEIKQSQAAQVLPESAGFLRKDLINDTEYLLEAIEAVLSDQSGLVKSAAVVEHPLTHLTSKQLEVLRMVAAGYSNGAIAQARNTGQPAVEVMLSNIYRALGIAGDEASNSRVLAARKYIEVFGINHK